jgi:hypothetical protein
MRVPRFLLVLFLLPCLVGCYAAKIDTGRPPSTTVIKHGLAACWLFGLVPPSTVETVARCPNGVSTVETQLSFVNQVVSLITFGIYTPMQIVVTCAEKPVASSALEPGHDFTVSTTASLEEIQSVYARAAEEAVKTHRSVRVFSTD